MNTLHFSYELNFYSAYCIHNLRFIANRFPIPVTLLHVMCQECVLTDSLEQIIFEVARPFNKIIFTIKNDKAGLVYVRMCHSNVPNKDNCFAADHKY